MAKALFLDRDGVINEEKAGSYIFHSGEFKFYKGALNAIVKLSKQFDYVLIVTNQRGIGRGLMTEQALNEIHDYLIEQVKNAGGVIHAIYFAPAINSENAHRKPNVGMALDAQKAFPDIDFSQSIMVGNNISDMKFGKNMNMTTIFLHTTQQKIVLPHDLIDNQFASLQEYADTFH